MSTTPTHPALGQQRRLENMTDKMTDEEKAIRAGMTHEQKAMRDDWLIREEAWRIAHRQREEQYGKITSVLMAPPFGSGGVSIHPIMNGPDRSIIVIEVASKDPSHNTERAAAVIQTILDEAARKIDPETAEVHWTYGSVLDPYGIYNLGPDDEDNVGRNYWARAPGSDVWVLFGDLPETTRDALWKKHARQLAFPAGLEGLPE